MSRRTGNQWSHRRHLGQLELRKDIVGLDDATVLVHASSISVTGFSCCNMSEKCFRFDSTCGFHQMLRSENVIDIAVAREARLRWYGHVIRRDEEELVKDIME